MQLNVECGSGERKIQWQLKPLRKRIGESKETKFWSTISLGPALRAVCLCEPLHFPFCLLRFVEIWTNVIVSIDHLTSVLFLLAKKTEPLLAIPVFSLFAAHGNASGIT